MATHKVYGCVKATTPTKWFNTLKEAKAYIKEHGGKLVKAVYPYAVIAPLKKKKQKSSGKR